MTRTSPLLLAGVVALVAACGKNDAVTKGAALGTGNFLALYVIGSDLEERFLAGSADLFEVAEGLKALTPEARAGLGFFVAFGGSKNEGWHGNRWADAECLVKDASDDKFGNDTCYVRKDENANMSAEATLRDFLAEAKTRSGGRNVVIADLWDHGSAYMGYGLDTVAEPSKQLSVSDIGSAFADAGFKPTIVYFDACLMASIEVANGLKDAASYLLASEELVPGSGQDYRRMIAWLAEHPDASAEETADRLSDAYLNGDSIELDSSTEPPTRTAAAPHVALRQKTMSFVRLDKVSPLVDAIDDLFANVQSNKAKKAMLRAVDPAAKFGYQAASKKRDAFSIDFGQLLDTWRLDEVDGGTTLASAAHAAYKDAIVFSKNDGTHPHASGISIFYPASANWESFYKDAAPMIGDSWKRVLTDAYAAVENDKTKPTMKKEKCTAAPQGTSEDGYCLDVDDDTILNEVTGYVSYEGHTYYVGPADYLNEKDRYFASKPDGTGLLLCDGACGDGVSYIAAPIQDFAGTYYAYGDLDGKSVYVVITADAAEASGFHVDVNLTDDPNAVVPKTRAARLRKGSKLTLTFFADADGATTETLTLTSGTIGGAGADLGLGDPKVLLQATDLAGNATDLELNF